MKLIFLQPCVSVFTGFANKFLSFHTVVNAAHSFYNGTTTLPISDEDRTPRKRISKTLNMTTSPEEKRKIIGDTFVKVIFIIICRLPFFK